jgi:hypothetical protein
MFNIQIARRPYRVDFRHEQILDCQTTHCVIANHRFTALGTAVCNGQNMSRNKRRKLALKNALENGRFDRTQRTRVWQRYFNRRGVIN